MGWGEVGGQWWWVGSGMAWGDSVHLLTRPPTPKDEEGNPAGLSSCSGGLRPLVELCVPRAAFPSGCLAAQTKRWAEGIRVPAPLAVQETRVATREESGVLGFPSRAAAEPSVALLL